MIQRIQTVYLLIAEMLIGALFFVPFAKILGNEGLIYQFDMKGIYLAGSQKPEIIYGSLPLVILCALSLIILLITIFKYKNRILQMRLSTINILLLIGIGGLIFYYVYSSAKLMQGSYSLNIYLVFPVVAAIFNYLAIRAIAKDELLVRSIDRIR